MRELTSRKVILGAINDPEISKSMNGVIFEDNNSDVFKKEALEAFVNTNSTFHWDSENSTLEVEYRQIILIKNLEKNDKFIFNDITFIVTKKYGDGSPLEASNQRTHEIAEFFWGGLEITKA